MRTRHGHALGGGGGHGHHGGHGGGHHGGGGWGRGGGGWWSGPAYYDPYPDVALVEVSNADQYGDEWKRRSMAYVLSLPKNQQSAAYQRLFGVGTPPAGVGDIMGTLTSNPIALAAAAGLVAYLLLRKKGG